jgi:hypothetical protein
LSAQTARLAITPAPAGKPGGPGLYHVKGMALPPYFENIRNALIRSGHTPAAAYRITWGAIRRWAHGGGKVHPEVVAAAQAALADLAAKSARAHAHANEDGAAMSLAWNGTDGIDLAAVELGSYIAPHMPAGSPAGGQFGTTSGGKGTPAQQHAAHDAHMAHLQHLVATGKATPAQRAELARLLAGKPAGYLSSPAFKKALAAVKASAVAPKAKKAAKPKAARKPRASAKPRVNKTKGTVTATVNGKKVTMSLHQWHALHAAHQKKTAAKATKLAGGDGRFLELAFTEALAERVPPGRAEGGQFAPVAAQLSRHDTPDQAARVINAMEPVQRAVVRASTLPPPGFSWGSNDRLTVADAR